MNEKVLVVDDNINNIRLLKEILEDENFLVHTSDDGVSTLEMVLNLKPDIILLDIMMPGMDGYEVCRTLKTNSLTQDIPVIMVTAKTEGEDVKRALDLGAFDYIKKPIDEIEVVARVQSALRFKKQQDKLKEMASRDGLTGVYNHALLLELFQKEFTKQERSGGNLAFVMLDIDHFKKVNDTYGHMAGDTVLKELTKIIVSNVRNGDIVGRYGGEEFGLVLTDISLEKVCQLCERIRQAIENNAFDIGTELIKITVSMGICFRKPDDSLTGGEMIKKADESLYKAKLMGRNRIELAAN
ncbi:diguanylate cyclase [Desulfosporosinus sp. PR]|uniref:diguanylate cyclase n=1 Tax=Candidatus Desulfosporosinus nitrosoreducens TaxID=3401928 RepID=UPI0027FB487A|nr:diguanylate cyclase [Desulfosporosinus sp. PR]MDQ7096863.1 diguanylate cyclase [Desulfosporosinus sp. PR]